jgi:hypothetical protein
MFPNKGILNLNHLHLRMYLAPYTNRPISVRTPFPFSVPMLQSASRLLRPTSSTLQRLASPTTFLIISSAHAECLACPLFTVCNLFYIRITRRLIVATLHDSLSPSGLPHLEPCCALWLSSPTVCTTSFPGRPFTPHGVHPTALMSSSAGKMSSDSISRTSHGPGFPDAHRPPPPEIETKVVRFKEPIREDREV